MAASESLRFDITVDDRASSGFSAAGRSASEAAGNVEKLSLRLDEVSRKSVAARVKLDGNKEALAELDRTDAKLLSLDRRVASPRLKVEGAARAIADISAVDIALDRLAKKSASPGILGRIGNLVPGLAGTGGGASGFGALAPAGSGLANPYVIGGALAGAAALAPFLGQQIAGAGIFGLGAGLAGLGIGGAFGLGASATPAQVAAAQNALKAAQLRLQAAQQANAKKSTPSTQAALLSAQGAVGTAQANLTSTQNNELLPGQIAVRNAFKNLSNDAQGSLSQIGKSFVPVMQSVFNTADSVLKKLTPVFAGAVQAISGPFKIFADTLIKSFDSPQVKTSIDAVATAFGKILTALAPGLPGDVNEIATGITKMANAVAANPQAFATFINDLFKIGQVALSVIADLTKTATYIEAHFRPALHDTAVIFDGVRHEVAHIADDMASALIRTYNALWNTIIGSTIRFGHNVETQWNSVTHEIAVIFDGMRGQLGRIYNNFWNDTIGATIRFGHNIETQWNSITGTLVGFFKALPGKILGVLGNLKNLLVQDGKDVIQGFWDGLTFIWNKVTGWISGLAGWIAKHKGPISLDRQLLYPAGRALMSGLKVGLEHGFVAVKDIVTGAAGDIGSWIMSGGNKLLGLGLGALHGLTGKAKSIWDSLFGGGAAGGGVSQWTGTVLQALSMEHLNTGLLGNVLHQIQTESGGNPKAQNNWDFNATVLHDPSRGLLQVIGSTFSAFHWPGTSWNIFDPLANIAAALNYARLRYGPDLMTGGMGIGSGHGYALGTLSAAPGWAWVGEHGPELMHFRGGEQVVPAGRAGGGNIYVTVNVPPTVNPAHAGQQIANLLGAHIKRGGRIYPAGVTPR